MTRRAAASFFAAILVALPAAVGAAGATGPQDREYGFSIEDPYLATVLGTPEQERAPIPAEPVAKDRSIDLFPERKIPDVFWQQGKFLYSVARQDHPAPLIFLVAGTGARYNSTKLRYLQAVFFQAGFNVVNLTSPTHTDFVVTGSRDSVPGNMREDVYDLYHAMDAIWQQLRDGMLVTRFYLAGYSLGASESAFLAELDSRARLFRFEKVLLINPSVDLLTSVQILDGMVRRALPEGVPELKRVFNDLFSRVATYFSQHHRAAVDVELLYHIAETERVTEKELETLIGVSFRISSGNMLFASDVMTGSHHLVQPGADLGVTTRLLPYMSMAGRWTWTDYLDAVLLPFWQQREAGLTRDGLVHSDSLHSIEDFLRGSPWVGLMTNRDDLILGPEDIPWIERTFGARATIYPRGGHCGNIMYRQNVADMLAFFGVGPDRGSGE